MVVIPSKHGFDAAAAAEVKLHPQDKDVWNLRRNNLKLLRQQGNDQEERLLVVEDKLKDLLNRPF